MLIMEKVTEEEVCKTLISVFREQTSRHKLVPPDFDSIYACMLSDILGLCSFTQFRVFKDSNTFK